MKKYKA